MLRPLGTILGRPEGMLVALVGCLGSLGEPQDGAMAAKGLRGSRGDAVKEAWAGGWGVP